MTRNRDSVVRVGSDRPEEVAQAVNSRTNPASTVNISEMKRDKSGWYLALIVLVFVIVFPVAMIIAGSKPLEIKMSSAGFTISGMYGVSVNYSDIRSVDTIAQLPPVKARTNGFAARGILKGKFRMKDDSRVRLFIDKRVSPIIVIDYQGTKMYLNNKNREETIGIYDELKNKINQPPRHEK